MARTRSASCSASPSPPDSKDTSVTSTLTRPSSPLTARTRPPLPDRLPTQVPHSPDLIPLTNGLGLVDLNRDASGSKLPAPAVAGPPPFDSRPRPVQGFQASFSPTVYFPFPPAPHGHYPLSPYYGEGTSPPSQAQQPFYPSYPPSSQDGQNGCYPHSQFSVDMRYRYTQFSPYGPQPHPYGMAPPPYSDAPSSSPYPISSCRPAVSSSHRPPPASMPSGLPPHQPRLQGGRRIPLTLKDKLERGSVTSSGICKFFDPAKGFGYLVDENHGIEMNGADVFFHYTGIRAERGFRCLSPGERVEYDLTIGSRPGKYQALNITGFQGAPLRGLSDPLQAEAVRRNSQTPSPGSNSPGSSGKPRRGASFTPPSGYASMGLPGQAESNGSN